jgi:hypothetical protein
VMSPCVYTGQTACPKYLAPAMKFFPWPHH